MCSIQPRTAWNLNIFVFWYFSILIENKKELEFSEKIDELNQETDTLLEEVDKWQM